MRLTARRYYHYFASPILMSAKYPRGSLYVIRDNITLLREKCLTTLSFEHYQRSPDGCKIGATLKNVGKKELRAHNMMVPTRSRVAQSKMLYFVAQKCGDRKRRCCILHIPGLTEPEPETCVRPASSSVPSSNTY